MKKILYKIFGYVPVLIFILLVPCFADAYTDEGIVMWASGGRVMARTYSDITGTLSTPFVAISGVNAKFINVKAAPDKKEFILGIQDTAGTLRVYHSTDGITWTSDWSVSIGDGSVARFDIGYEQLTGRAIITYRGRILTSRTTFYYRIWSAGVWAAQVEMRSTVGTYTGNIVNIKLASRPNSNQMAMIYVDDKFYAVATFWSGTAWTFAPAAITTNSPRYGGFAGVFPPLSNASVEFESQSGDALYVSGQNDADRTHYLTRSAAGTWSSVLILNTINNYGDYTKLIASPTTNEIILTSCMMEPNSAAYACSFVLWSGTAFGTVSNDGVTGQIVDGDEPVDAFWLTDSGNTAAVAVYDDSSTLGIDWQLSLNNGSFVSQTPDSGSPAIQVNEGQIIASNIVGAPGEALAVITDESNAVYMKRAKLTGTSVVWSGAVSSSLAEITQGANLADSSNFARAGISLQTAPPVLIVSTTTANTRRRIPAGTSSYIAGSSCLSESDCSGFVLGARGKSSISVSSITLTNTGTINLTNTGSWELGIDSDANPNNGVTRTVTGSVSGNNITFTISPALVISNGQKFYAFPRATFGTNPYPASGDTITLGISSPANITASATLTPDKYILGSPTVYGVIVPNIISYTNNTESSLSNTGVACTNCGGRLGAGILGHTITITGIGFGTTKGTVSINGSSLTNIATSSISSWSNTGIVFTLDSSVAGNSDSSFGTNYGGSSALSITSNGQQSDALDFIIFPQIESLTTPISSGADAAKEYNAGDTDGIITILGTRFGGVEGSSKITVLGCSQTTCSSPADSVYVTSWSNTSITIRVPTTIPDNLYTGNIILKRVLTDGTPDVNETYKNTFSIRPRILSISPTSGSFDTDLAISGNHLCPIGGVCPAGSIGIDSNLTSSPGFSTGNRVIFGGAVSDYFNTWSDTQIQTRVPSSLSEGATTASVTAGSYNAGSVPFTVTLVSIPVAPASLNQYKGTSTLNTITVGGSTSNGQIAFGSMIGSIVSGSGTMRMSVEAVPIGSAFVCGNSSCISSIVSPWVSSQPSLDCRVASNGCYVSTTFTDNAYHWRARTELVFRGTTYYSAWVNYPDTSPNLESDTDFWVDSTGPIILNLSAGTPSTNSTTISWDTNEKTDTLVEVNKTGTFTDNCVASDGCTGSSVLLTLNKSVSVKSLSTNTTYYYRVRSRDSAGNVAWSSVQQFKTLAISKPAKTLYFHALSKGGLIGEYGSTTGNFSINIPESNPEFQSIFVDVRGMYSTDGIETSAGLKIGVNGETKVTYSLPGGYSVVSSWRLFHKVLSLNLSPGINTITISALKDTQLSALSADIIVSYLYTP